MGKRTTGRAKGKGSFTFQVRKKAYVYRISYPRISVEGKAKVEKLINSLAHTSPLAEIKINNENISNRRCRIYRFSDCAKIAKRKPRRLCL